MARGKTVNTQMDSKTIGRKGSEGCYDHNPTVPFTEPAARGVIPLKFMDETLKPGKMPTPTQTAGAETRSPRPGTRQRYFGKSDE